MRDACVAVAETSAQGAADTGALLHAPLFQGVGGDSLERLAAAKGITSRAALAERRAAWDRAAHATPHGQPILLANDPLARST